MLAIDIIPFSEKKYTVVEVDEIAQHPPDDSFFSEGFDTLEEAIQFVLDND